MNNTGTKKLIVASGTPSPNLAPERVVLVNDAGEPIDIRTTAEIAALTTITWKPNTAYTAGTIVSYQGNLYSVNADYTSGSSWTGAGLTAFSSRFLSRASFAGYRSREVAPTWALDVNGLAVLTSSGLTTSSGKIAASVGGTDGNAIIPLWGPRTDWRGSYKLHATKAAASSKSYIGVTETTRGTLPSAGSYTFGVGYKQGSGIVMFRENVSTDTVLYADASITDGDVFDVELIVAASSQLDAGSSSNTIYAVIRNASGTIVYSGGAVSWNEAFYNPPNVLIRTNVAAGGLSAVKISASPINTPGTKEAWCVSNLTASETLGLRLPATPNGRIVYHLHGHGANPTVALNDSLLRGCFAALTDAGYTVAIPAMGGDLWGNTDALAYISSLHTLLTATYGLDDQACYLFGNSMGGGAACTLISNGTLPVKAAYLAQPAVDYDALSSNPSFTTINTAYPTSALRDASNPLKRSAATYTGVPILLVSSASDTTIAKSTNADALNTLISGSTTVHRLTATGNHNDASHFRPGDMANFFLANQ